MLSSIFKNNGNIIHLFNNGVFKVTPVTNGFTLSNEVLTTSASAKQLKFDTSKYNDGKHFIFYRLLATSGSGQIINGSSTATSTASVYDFHTVSYSKTSMKQQVLGRLIDNDTMTFVNATAAKINIYEVWIEKLMGGGNS